MKESIQIPEKHSSILLDISAEKNWLKNTHTHTHTHRCQNPPLNAPLPHQKLANFLTELGAPNLTLCSLGLRKGTFFWSTRRKWTPLIQQRNNEEKYKWFLSHSSFTISRNSILIQNILSLYIPQISFNLFKSSSQKNKN